MKNQTHCFIFVVQDFHCLYMIILQVHLYWIIALPVLHSVSRPSSLAALASLLILLENADAGSIFSPP